MDDQWLGQAQNQLLGRCDQLAQFSELEDGILRQYLTPQHAAANELVAQWMVAAKMTTWADAVGNQWGRLASSNADAPSIVIGSHLDTVPYAGRYDGILGVLLGIEVARYFAEQKQALPFHLDVVGFADEEGTRFATTLIGSKALAGNFSEQWLTLCDNNGISMVDALKKFGLSPDKISSASLVEKPPLAYLEAHIEQGPVLEAAQQPLGIVSGIAGARRAKFTFTGQAGHAGTTPMNLRKDALACAAETILAVENLALAKTEGEVATVGDIQAEPGATNVIAGRCSISLDVRALDDQRRDQLIKEITLQAEQAAQKRGAHLSIEWMHEAAASPCDAHLQQVLFQAAQSLGIEVNSLPSGAGHDAMAIASLCPMAMLFVRSPKGLSHHPDEAVIPKDVGLAIATMVRAVAHLAEVNAL